MTAPILGEKPKLPPPSFVTLLRDLSPDGTLTPDQVGVNPQTGQVLAQFNGNRYVDANTLVEMFRKVVREEIREALELA